MTGHGGTNGAVPIPDILWRSCDGMMVIDEHRRVMAMNPTLERWTGCRNHEVIGRSECGTLLACRNLHGCPLADHPKDCPGVRAIQQRKPVEGAEYTIQTAEGRTIVVGASYTPIQLRPGAPVWTLVVMRDVTLQKRREQQLAHRAMTDALTGLPNRTSFWNACRKELKRSFRNAKPLAIAVMDVDGFKAFNDRHGHLAGDWLLRALARVLRIGHRGAEIVARYGGDEFGILLQETDAAGAVVIAERMRRTIEDFPFARPAGGVRVTVSVGLAVFPSDGTTAHALFTQADGRLYEAKRRGRNQTIGPWQRQERRRQQRIVDLNAPAGVRSLDVGVPGTLQEGTVRNLSLGGAYLVVPPWRVIAANELILLSIEIPVAHHSQFPLSRLEGRGRVVRVDGLGSAEEAGGRRLGLAVEFLDDLVMQVAMPKQVGPSPPYPDPSK